MMSRSSRRRNSSKGSARSTKHKPASTSSTFLSPRSTKSRTMRRKNSGRPRRSIYPFTSLTWSLCSRTARSSSTLKKKGSTINSTSKPFPFPSYSGQWPSSNTNWSTSSKNSKKSMKSSKATPPSRYKNSSRITSSLPSPHKTTIFTP